MPGPDPSLVRDFPFFAGARARRISAPSCGRRATRRIARKAAVFEQGEPAGEFFVLLHGHLKVVQTTPDGRQVIVRIVEPGELYGVAVALGRPDYPATAIAMEESLTLVWPSVAMGRPRRAGAAPCRERAEDARAAGAGCAYPHPRSLHRGDRAARRARAAADHRAAGACSRRSGRRRFPITRQDIAEMTGTTLFTVSRILSAWEQQGLVSGGRERISVRQPGEAARDRRPRAGVSLIQRRTPRANAPPRINRRAPREPSRCPWHPWTACSPGSCPILNFIMDVSFASGS